MLLHLTPFFATVFCAAIIDVFTHLSPRFTLAAKGPFFLSVQSWEKTVDCYSPGQGLMPASFKVRTVSLDGNNQAFEEVLDPDFGESAIGRVAPVDSGEPMMGGDSLFNRFIF